MKTRPPALLFLVVIMFGSKLQAQSVASLRVDVVPLKGMVEVVTEGETMIAAHGERPKSAPPAQISDSEAGSKPVAMVSAGPGAVIKTGNDPALITLGANGSARLDPNTEVKVPEGDAAKTQSLELLKGRLFLNVDPKKKKPDQEIRLKTPTLLLAIKGTKFFASAEPQGEAVGVHEGQVEATRDGRAAPLANGEILLIDASGKVQKRRLAADELKLDGYYGETLEWQPANSKGKGDWTIFATDNILDSNGLVVNLSAKLESFDVNVPEFGRGLGIRNKPVLVAKSSALNFPFKQATKSAPMAFEAYLKSSRDDEGVRIYCSLSLQSLYPGMGVGGILTPDMPSYSHMRAKLKTAGQWTRVLLPLNSVPSDAKDLVLGVTFYPVDAAQQPAPFDFQVIPTGILVIKGTR